MLSFLPGLSFLLLLVVNTLASPCAAVTSTADNVASSIVSTTTLGQALASASSTCLSLTEQAQLADAYGTLIANYSSDLANVVLAPNFTDYSESVNSLIDGCPQGSAAASETIPLDAPTFTNRTLFEIGQGQQPPINFFQLDLFPGCTTVSFRWKTTNTAPIPDPRPVYGIIVLNAIPAPDGNPYPYWIDTVYSEFDAAAWLDNLNDAGFCATSTASCAVAPITATALSTASTSLPGSMALHTSTVLSTNKVFSTSAISGSPISTTWSPSTSPKTTILSISTPTVSTTLSPDTCLESTTLSSPVSPVSTTLSPLTSAPVFTSSTLPRYPTKTSNKSGVASHSLSFQTSMTTLRKPGAPSAWTYSSSLPVKSADHIQPARPDSPDSKSFPWNWWA